MSQPSSSPPATSFRQGPAMWLLGGLGIAVLTICFFSPARELIDPRLDQSNYASYAYFTARGFAYGPEVVPMAGPLGFVPYGFLYAGQLFWKRLPLELLTKAVFATLAVWFFRRASPQPVMRWLWLGTLFVMVPLVEDLSYDLAVLLAGLTLVELYPRRTRSALVAACGLASYLALLSLFKGTQAMLAFATLGLLGVQALLLRDFRRLFWIVGAYLVTLVFSLIASGQNPAHFLSYLRGMLELSSGYNLAMGLDETHASFLTGLWTVLALEALVLTILLSRWRQPGILAGGLLLAGFTFVEWKHGYVRADGHVLIFLHYAAVAAPTSLLFAGRFPGVSRPVRLCMAGLAGAAFSLAAWGHGISTPERHIWSLQLWWERLPLALRQITSPAADKARLDAALAARRRTYELPRVKEMAGAARIDFFGTEQGYLLLNGLNYRPRPMGGGTFNVFTPWLQDRNTAYLSDPLTRPDFYLAAPGTIDQRFLAEDDPGTLRALLSLYAPVASEQGLVLFQARSGQPPLPAPRLIREQVLKLGEAVEVPVVGPDEILLVSFSLPLNLSGRVRAFLYKPPLLFMDLQGDGLLEPNNRRIVPNLCRNPVPLSPALEDTRDLLATYQRLPGKTVHRFTLHSPHPGLWGAGRLAARFYAAPRPAPEPAIAAQLIQSLAFPVANAVPVAMNPPNSPPRRFDGLPVQMLEPPGFIRFALDGQERELSFKFGLDPAAYLTGLTDGVEFIVDLERPGQPPQSLFRRWLRPRSEPADRGTHGQRVALPPFPAGSTLALRTDMGADRNGAWDWGYYTGIRLIAGSYQLEQFPRFTHLPGTVDAATAGRLPVEGRDLFMLNPPGMLVFKLTGVEKKLTFAAGLLPGAYTNGGHSDGVGLVVELNAPDGSVSRIFERQLNPLANEADRGDQICTVPLPAIAPGTRLRLVVTPGLSGNGAWDWSYIESLQIH